MVMSAVCAMPQNNRAREPFRARRADRRRGNKWEEDAVTRRTRRAAIAGGLSALMGGPARFNADWPDHPITMVHGFPAGGPTDLVARIVADGLTRRLGQRIVVEGRSGASGTTAAAQVARAAPDGYTLFAV